MTHDPNNWTDVTPLVGLGASIPMSLCRRCGTVVFSADWQDDRDLHEAWHDDVAHQLAQARA